MIASPRDNPRRAMRVMVITNNLQQASFRLRIDALRRPLDQRGIQLDIRVRPRGSLARRRLLRSAADFDAVILQRKLLDPIDVRLLRKHSRKFFYDVDDAVMVHSRPVGPFQRWQTRRRFRAVARSVDLVVAGNNHLAHLFQCEGAPAMVLPTVVDPAHYAVKSHTLSDSPSLVWIGSRSTLQYLEQFHEVLREAAARVPNLRLITIADELLPDPPIPTEHVMWSEASESSALIRGDIGIAPTPENPWTLGKCGFKIVQYMAAGLPAIASPVGANREIILLGETGYLPETPAQWCDAIAALAENPAKRQQMGAAARGRAEEHYSLDRAAEFWAEQLSRDQVR